MALVPTSSGQEVANEEDDAMYWKEKCKDLALLDERWSRFQFHREYYIDVQGTITDMKLDGDFLAVGVRDDHGIHVYQQNTQGEWSLCFRHQNMFITSCLDIQVLRTQETWISVKVAAGSYSGQVKKNDTDTRELAVLEYHNTPLQSHLAISRKQGHVRSMLSCKLKQDYIFTGGADHMIIVWKRMKCSNEEWNLVQMHCLQGHTSGVLDIHTHQECVVSLGLSCSILVWDQPTITSSPPSSQMHVGLVLGFSMCDKNVAVVTESHLNIYRLDKTNLVLVAELNLFDKIPAPSLLELRLIKIGLNARGFILLTTSNRQQSWLVNVQSCCGIQSTLSDALDTRFHLIQQGQEANYLTPNLSHKMDATRFLFLRKSHGTRLVVVDFSN